MRKLFGISLAMLLAISLSLVAVAPVAANDVASSTMIFEGALTDNGDGTYSEVIPMVVDGGYDIYAREGSMAWFGDDPGTGAVWTSVTISNHDAWPAPEWSPDTPDWYQYSLELTDGKWAVRNHPGATAANPWSTDPNAYPPKGVPMSGTMDWAAMYAAETDTGAYLTGTAEIPGGAKAHGGGPACWDMDWSWGSEAVPLQYPGFDVTEEDLNGGEFRVTMTPAAAGATVLTVDVPDITAISVDPTSIDFGTLLPGKTSATFNIDVENLGTRTVDVDVNVYEVGLFYDSLEMTNNGSPPWSKGPWDNLVAGLGMGAVDDVQTRLTVPEGYTPKGAEEATLVFEAEAV